MRQRLLFDPNNLMLVFAFNVLVIAVCAASGYFYVRWQRAEFKNLLRAQRRQQIRKVNSMSAEVARLTEVVEKQRVEQATLDAKLRMNAGLPGPAPANPFNRMEDRYVSEVRQATVVQNKNAPQKVGAVG